MKKLSVILLLLLTTFFSNAQTQLAAEFEQALQFTDKAWEFSQNATSLFQLFNGAADMEEIKYHSYEALAQMDSLFIYAKKAEFKATDAEYSAGDLHLPNYEQTAIRIKNNLKAASQSITESSDKLNLIFDEVVYSNLAIQLNQSLDYFNACRRQLKQAQRDLKLTLKSISKK